MVFTAGQQYITPRPFLQTSKTEAEALTTEDTEGHRGKTEAGKTQVKSFTTEVAEEH
ncbi:hypothetical protein GEOBRER4_n2561 [Citrifermentans bremense]|uniref:Uncharacterized protein n=1 Tax=Citrifermentans bremense TaxID=60035 RepID=A0A7R7IYV3_9BACT|nr:hypothetical protein GEOBRER4_n2561 [Citrifermentans bremense]